MSLSKIIALALAALLLASPARSQILLSPTRVVFDGPARAIQVDVVNTSGKAAIYRLSVVNRRMTEDGDLVAIDSPLPGERFVGDMVRFSPRQLTLEPGSSQVVRLSLRKPADLPPGEYRSHLLFEQVEEGSEASSVEAAASGPSGRDLQIRLTILVGAIIPLIVREGPATMSAQLRDVVLQPGQGAQPPVLSFGIRREGSRSAYGDVVVNWQAAGSSAPVEVARLSGLAVYVPNESRRVRLALQPPEGVTVGGKGRLRVTFQARPEDGGRAFAESELELK
ncbi:MAG: molecular chaperone [Rubrivivax sp.]